MSQKVSGIYVIVNTKNGKVYVGQAVDFTKRWKQHERELKGNYHGNRHLQAAWNKYGERVFKFQKLEYCDIEQLNEREEHHVAIYRTKGLAYNMQDGGNTTKGRIVSEETRHKLSASLKGRIVNKETRRKISEGHKNPSAETRYKMSIAGKKRIRQPCSEETRRKLSEAQKGKKPSEETLLRLSESHKGQPSPNKGKKFTDETRHKMSESAKLRAARKRAEREAAANGEAGNGHE